MEIHTMSSDLFNDLKNIKTKINQNEKIEKEKVAKQEKDKKEEKLKKSFVDFMNQAGVKKLS
ncbi:MAG: hypothetical protein PHW07_08395 [Sulfurospirillaceae bacterium]|nr:hypothetical protein [Sulfurospirillaceae bacterium]